MSRKSGDVRKCVDCGAIGVPQDETRCKPCRIGHESGPQARKDYLSTIAKKGAEASRRSRAPGLEEEDLGPLECAEDAMRWAHKIALACAAGKISSRRASALRSLLKEWRASREDHIVEGKMQELESRLDELRKQGVV